MLDRVRTRARSRWLRLSIRLLSAGGVLVAVVAHVGTGPFVHGLLSIDGPTIGAAVVLTAIATAAASWRWRLIAKRFGVDLRWSRAIALYYQSQFLNTVLPGGVIGDVHRAVSHGRSADKIGAAARAVVIERSAGQVVQLIIALVLVVCFGAEFTGYLFATTALGLAGLVAIVIVAVAASARIRVAVQHGLAELRTVLGSVRVATHVAIASVIVVLCHAMTFAIATAAVAGSVPPPQLLALALVILLGASIPLNIGGWGPREGIAGWAFAVLGFGAATGVAASTLFGVLAIISVAPGAVVMVVFAARRRKAAEPAVSAASAARADRSGVSLEGAVPVVRGIR